LEFDYIRDIHLDMSEVESFLKNFHAKYPGCTVPLEDGKTSEGLSSYEILVNTCLPKGSVLDLACGDGYLLQLLSKKYHSLNLFGLDMSEGELSAAKTRLANSPIKLMEGRAQELPLTDQSMDSVLCHMAFMLMNDIEKVIGEIHRVLKPGGIFSGVVGAKNNNGEIWNIFSKLLDKSLEQEGKNWSLRLGDKRTRSEEGLRSLFAPDAFEQPISIAQINTYYQLDPDAATSFCMLMYDVDLLSAVGKTLFEKSLRSEVEKLADVDGKVHFSMGIAHFTCRRVN